MPKKTPSKSLTDAEIRNAKPRDVQYGLSDGDGLSCEIMPTGRKRWRYRFRLHGEPVRQWLGYYPDMGLTAARKAHAHAAALVAEGQDPRQVKQVEKAKQAIAAINTFEAIACEWIGKERPRWTSTHADRVLISLQVDAFPDLGALPVASITAPLVLAAIRKIEQRGVTETAGRVLQRISSVLRYAVQTGRIESNPARDLTGVLRASKVTHQPALPRAELPEFYRRLEAEPLHHPTRIAMHLLMLTLVRPGELRAARWDEFDLTEATWRIPAERMKMRSPHLIPLSRQALALLTELHTLTGNHDLLFPGQIDHTRPMSENTLGYALGRMGYKNIATAHGMRALASTVLNEEGFKPDIIERQLAHAERNKVRAAYHRAEYLEDRKTMLQWYADFLDSKKPGANVVPMKRWA